MYTHLSRCVYVVFPLRTHRPTRSVYVLVSLCTRVVLSMYTLRSSGFVGLLTSLPVQFAFSVLVDFLPVKRKTHNIASYRRKLQ